jgi:hypothetical protein
MTHYKDIHAKDISSISYFPKEAEILFSGQTSLFVKRGEGVNDIVYVAKQIRTPDDPFEKQNNQELQKKDSPRK